MSANDILVSAVKSVCQVFTRFVEEGGAANWNRAVDLIEEQMQIVRRSAAGATQIPAMLIAADVYWRKTKNEWPDWAKIAECDEEGIKHHPWYARVTYELFPFDSEEDAAPTECEDEETRASRLMKPEPRDETIEASEREAADVSIGAEDEDEEDTQKPQDNAASREDLKTSKSSRSGRKRANRPKLHQPPNACSTCVEFGVTCVPRSNAACQPCSQRKKRCEHSTGIGRGRAKTRPTARSIQSPLALPASKRRQNSSAEHPPPDAELPPPPTKRRRLVPREPPSRIRREPIIIRIPPLRRSSSLPRLTTGRKTIPAKSAIPPPASSILSHPRTHQAMPGACYTLAGEPLVSRREYSSLCERQDAIERRLDDLRQQIGSLHAVVEGIRARVAILPPSAPPPPTTSAPFWPPMSSPAASSQRVIAPSSPSLPYYPSRGDSASSDAFSNGEDSSARPVSAGMRFQPKVANSPPGLAISLTDEVNWRGRVVSKSPTPSEAPQGSTAAVNRPLPAVAPPAQSGPKMPQGSPRVYRGNSLPRIETLGCDEGRRGAERTLSDLFR